MARFLSRGTCPDGLYLWRLRVCQGRAHSPGSLGPVDVLQSGGDHLFDAALHARLERLLPIPSADLSSLLWSPRADSNPSAALEGHSKMGRVSKDCQGAFRPPE